MKMLLINSIGFVAKEKKKNNRRNTNDKKMLELPGVKSVLMCWGYQI